MEDYWEYSGGIPIEEAKATAKAHGFELEIGRISRFDNARGVVIGHADVQNGLVNKILLAEEIQHDLDRERAEASRAISRRLSSEQFHVEVFRRILLGARQGGFQFLTDEDVRAIETPVGSLGRKRG